MQDQLERYSCPACGSLVIYYQVKKDAFICRRCGENWIKGGLENDKPKPKPEQSER